MKELILDSSAITAYLQCGQYKQYKYDDNLNPISTFIPPSELIGSSKSKLPPRMNIMQAGTYGHWVVENYYRSKIGLSYAKEPICKDLTLEHKKFIDERCLLYTYKYEVYNDIIPVQTEVGFSHPVVSTKTTTFILEGRIDFLGRLSKTCDTPIFADHKFQAAKRKLNTKSIQFRNYALVTGYDLGIINYVRLSQSTDKDTFERDTISFSKDDMRDWSEEVKRIFYRIYESGAEVPNKNWSNCEGKFNIPCPYKILCDESNAVYRNALQTIRFYKGEKWTPWQEEEDVA